MINGNENKAENEIQDKNIRSKQTQDQTWTQMYFNIKRVSVYYDAYMY